MKPCLNNQKRLETGRESARGRGLEGTKTDGFQKLRSVGTLSLSSGSEGSVRSIPGGVKVLGWGGTDTNGSREGQAGCLPSVPLLQHVEMR